MEHATRKRSGLMRGFQRGEKKAGASCCAIFNVEGIENQLLGLSKYKKRRQLSQDTRPSPIII